VYDPYPLATARAHELTSGRFQSLSSEGGSAVAVMDDACGGRGGRRGHRPATATDGLCPTLDDVFVCF